MDIKELADFDRNMGIDYEELEKYFKLKLNKKSKENSKEG